MIGALVLASAMVWRFWSAARIANIPAQPAAAGNDAPIKGDSPAPGLAAPTASERLTFRPVGFPPEKGDHQDRLDAFDFWRGRYAASSTVEKARLEAEGVALARQRLAALTELILTDPEQALRHAVPPMIRRSLPAAVQALLETPINTRADYEVLCVLPMEGQKPVADGELRVAVIGEERYLVRTYGPGLEYLTHRQAPLNGIAVPLDAATAPPENEIARATRLLALDPNPGRLLEAGEFLQFQAVASQPLVCQASGRALAEADQPVAVEWAGEILAFRDRETAEAWATTNAETASLSWPQPPANLPVAASSYTEGRKRFIVFRVDFPDYPGEVMSTNQALTLMSGMSNFMADVSYAKLVLAPVGQGSDITPTMRLPNSQSNYTDMGNLLGACRTAATALGYDMSRYDFYFVCTAGKPSASFAGLGYVGGVGFWLANSYFDVRTGAHEFGHNLGLGHANWWDTGGKSIMGAGTSEEYGDPFDTMGGSGGGARHFSSYSKNKLGWIPNADCPTVTQSGLYRLHAHDTSAAIGVRGLRLNRSGGNYWVEYRQRFTANKALLNGVGLRWVGGSTTLLDANPGSSSGKDDHPLTIGRTFSEPNLGWHLTPIGLGRTYPESVDVVVNFGAFPGNRPPTVIVRASTLAASVNQPVTFTAEAADPDGDALAYFWDFGNGNYSTNNQPEATVSFSSAGEYYVECTVSDMKGGVGGKSVIVRVGSPSTYRISGRILATNGLPVTGIKVYTDASHYAFTESDGTFTLTRLGAGNHTVSVTEPVQGAKNFLNPFFNNPITVGPSYTNADFILWPGSLNIYSPLAAKGSNWRYLDNGSDLGTNWLRFGFNDQGWSNGAAILGYGQGNETTVLGYGPASTNKYITYYFRQTLSVPNPAAYTNLLLEVLRDDGIVVYLNEQEVYRDNMPTGAVSATTLALQPVEPDNYLSTNLPPALLRAGTNLLAVEIHQVDPTSSDINFDLGLSGLSTTNASGINLVYLATPRDLGEFDGPTNLVLTAVAQSGLSAIAQVTFLTNGSPAGADASAPYALTLTNLAPGTHQLRAVAVLAGGAQITSAPVSITVRAPQPAPPAPVSLALVATGSAWRFFSGPTGAPPDWLTASFDDSSWSNGLAELGYGENDEATKVAYGANSNNKWITAYFRRAFVVNDPYSITSAVLRLKRDDGAAVYLNGQEIARDLLPPGPLTHNTLATNASDDGKTFFAFNFTNLPFYPGTNVLAVEVHQSATNSSDLSFDLSLDAVAATNRPRGVWITAPANGLAWSATAPLPLACEAIGGGNLGISRVQWRANAIVIGESAVFPFGLTWTNPLPGVFDLTAVATDGAGGAVTSAPARITVRAPAGGAGLVSFGEVWKYLDDGSNLGTNWITKTYDDRLWSSGAARLGYGGDGEITQVSDGGNPAWRHITTYFRKHFLAADIGRFDSLRLRLISDDGAVVYLNGREVFRHNMPEGLVTFNSLATAAVSGAAESTPVEIMLDRADLVGGTNILAVEMHQAAIDSSDLGFDLELTALAATAPGEPLWFVAPSDGAVYSAPASIPLAVYGAGAGVQPVQVEYFSGAVRVAPAVAAPFNATWTNVPIGVYELTARAVYPGGTAVTSAPVQVRVVPPPFNIEPVLDIFIPGLTAWRYWDSSASPGTNWAALGFDDSAWPEGPARFGWGLDGERTTLTAGRITHYFRRSFEVTNPLLFTEMVFQLARDDGAVVYLNGREVFRSNMPTGAVTAATLASRTVDTPEETTYFETVVPLTGTELQPGANVVAVELHQGGANSSDAGFDLQMFGLGTTEPRLLLRQPAAPVQVYYGQPITMESLVWAGGAAPNAPVEYFINGRKIGESQAGPFVWTNAPLGTHALTATRDLGQGRSLAAGPVAISVIYEPLTLSLISTGAAWNYFDLGRLPATNWHRRSFDDRGWSNGLARLGYGGDGERTVVSYGPSANNKYVTTYFRRWFEVPANATFTNLAFRLCRDDGAVVYLNGVEVYRSNMPTGAVAYGTLASSAVSTEEQTYFPFAIEVGGLLAGSNLVAVEVHQSSLTSSDLGFDLGLTGQGYIGPAPAAALAAPLAQVGLLQIAWPTNMIGWDLYSSTNLAPGSVWTPVTTGLFQSNGWHLLQVWPAGPRAFYRLEQR